MSRRLLPLLLIAACLPVTDAAAQEMQMAKFKVTIRGTQVSTWSLRQNPTDPCDASQKGDGSQMIRFTSKPKIVQVVRGSKVFGPGTRIFPFIEADTVVDREGDYEVGSVPSDCPSVAIGDSDGLVPLKDCGRRTGTASLQLQQDPEQEPDEDGLVPLVPRDALWVKGDLEGNAFGYAECPWWISGPAESPSESELLPTWERSKAKHLFDRRRKVIKVAGDFSRNYSAPGFTGKTLITWNVRMVRVG